MRIVFAGTPDFAAACLRALLDEGAPVVGVLTQPDRPAGRGRRLAASPVKRLAESHALAIQQPRTLRDAEAVRALAGLRPDLLLVAAYGLLLPAPVLDMPRLGCVNVHASLLPRWRGAAPIQRAILAGDDESGVCLMRMEAGLDTGPVLARRRCVIGSRDSAGDLHDRLAALGAALLIDSLPALVAGELVAEPQPATGATYAERLGKEEAWLDWSSSATRLDRMVRAFNPWPVGCTRLRGERLRIWQAKPLAATAEAAPGTLLEASPAAVTVACGEGSLQLLELQLPGGRRMSASEMVHGGRLQPGLRLGAESGAGS